MESQAHVIAIAGAKFLRCIQRCLCLDKVPPGSPVLVFQLGPGKSDKVLGFVTQQPGGGGGFDAAAAAVVWGGPVPEVPVQSLPPASTLSLLKYAEANTNVPTWEKHNKKTKNKK